MDYINLGQVSPALLATGFELPNVLPLLRPTLLVGATNAPVVYYLGKRQAAEVVNPDVMPLLVRGATDAEFGPWAVVPGGTTIFFLCRHGETVEETGRALGAAIANITRSYGLTVTHSGNDLFFGVGSGVKKFCGFVNEARGEWAVCGQGVTFRFDADLARQSFAATSKAGVKGTLETIEQFVGGLWEAAPALDPREYADRLAASLAVRYGEQLIPRDLNETERVLLERRAAELTGPDWLAGV